MMRLSPFLTILTSVLLHRVFLLTTPHFAPAVRSAPVLNAVTGVVSDITLLACVYMVVASLQLIKGHKFQQISQWALWGLVAGMILALAAHVRYVLHFGMTLMPFHLSGVASPDVMKSGPLLVVTTWQSLTMIVVPFAVAALAFRYLPKSQPITLKRWTKVAAFCSALALASQSFVINIRSNIKLHSELIYNPVLAYVNNAKTFKKLHAEREFSKEEQAQVQAMLFGGRFLDDSSTEYPLWQKNLAAGVSDPKLDDIRSSLQRAIASYQQPPNVVLVLSESFRAADIKYFQPDLPERDRLTPEFDRISAEGISFTEMYAVGVQTHIGQAAVNCSALSTPDVSILQLPTVSAFCLQDLFAQKNFETYFFYASDNRFDNQHQFYAQHNTKHIISELDFDKNTPKGGWGYSDHALFEHAFTKLKEEKKPFFATILTLTHHMPYQVPSDMPEELDDKSLPERQRLLRYVSWSTGLFYEKMRNEFPNTIFIFTSDQGAIFEDPPADDSRYGEYARQVLRVPFVLIVPGMDDSLKGLQVDKLTSHLDIAPTLAKLMGWHSFSNQFVGMDMFERTGPAIAICPLRKKELILLDRIDARLAVETISHSVKDAYTLLLLQNMLAPMLPKLEF